jgi:hypothetical protein
MLPIEIREIIVKEYCPLRWTKYGLESILEECLSLCENLPLFAIQALYSEEARQSLRTILQISVIIEISIAVADGLRSTIVVVMLECLQRLHYLVLVLSYEQVL